MSLKYDDARVLDSLCYDLVLGDWPRSLNRTRIQELCNGYPPYTDAEVEANGIAVNVNDLSHTRLAHDARTQFSNAFMKTGNFFSAKIDRGPVHDRQRISTIVTKEANRPIRRSIQYFERQRSKFGMLVLQGISPGVWETQDKVIARAMDIGDMLIPSRTLLGFDNLPFFVVRRSFTGVELQHLTSKAKRDPGWQMPMVKRVLEWVDKETMELRSTNWSDIWSPEKVSERVKEDGGFYMGDQVPTIDCFDIYGYEDDGKEAGWIRRIILDSWGQPSQSGGGYTLNRRAKAIEAKGPEKADFLFTSGKRRVAESWQQLAAFQFADLSAVFPARYHSVRSLGWLLYAACHMGNRLRCKFYESVFEALMQQFKVKNLDDAQRALKLDLVNRGFIDETLSPVPAAERWQVNSSLVELGLQDNQNIIQRSASSYTGQPSQQQRETEKTRYQVQAEQQATTALVAAALNQAYQYEVFEDREMFRRLCRKNSTDPMARTFRANCLRQRVPEKMLNDPEAWEIDHERVMGGGNKTQELQIAQWMMQNRPAFDPQPQRQILKDCVLAVTDDAARAEALVPQAPVISDSIHDTELAFGALMIGGQVSIKAGLNAIEVCARMLQLMQQKVQEIMKTGGVGTPQDVQGLARCDQYVRGYMKILEADPQQQQHVKQLGDVLGKVMNLVKAMAQRQQQAAKARAAQAQEGNGGADAAKIKATAMQAKAKIEQGKQSHAAKTAQRQITFEREEQRREQEHRAEMRRWQQEFEMEAAAKDLQTATEIRHSRAKTGEEIRTSRLRNLSQDTDLE